MDLRLGTKYLVLLLAGVLTAPAATISFTYNGVVNGHSLQMSKDSGATWSGNFTAGQMSITVTAVSGLPTYVLGNHLTFCIEPNESIGAGSYTYDVLDLQAAPSSLSGMGAVKADLLRELYATYYPSFVVNQTVTRAAALQLATWEIVQETSGTYNVSSGVMRWRNNSGGTNATRFANIVADANAMLAAITPVGGALLTQLYGISNAGAPGKQDLAFHAVPEPASVGLLLLGAVMLRGRVRRAQ